MRSIVAKITGSLARGLGRAIVALGFGAGCSAPGPSATPALPNQVLLQEIDRAGAGFHARKTRPIWARELTADQEVQTLEGLVQAKAGDFLCRGEAGELWPQRAASLTSKYTATDQVDADGWRQYTPRPDAEGVMAAQVPHPFTVQAKWGPLTGKPGDYVLKNFRDREVANPEDVWLVDQALFRATYATASP
jgi:hypothetical protein